MAVIVTADDKVNIIITSSVSTATVVTALLHLTCAFHGYFQGRIRHSLAGSFCTVDVHFTQFLISASCICF